MSSAVQSRPDLYALLGLKPTASADDIGRAFVREMRSAKPRRFGGLAQLGMAYETLRDPARRRAYDESIGVRKERPKAPAPYVSCAMFVRPPSTYADHQPRLATATPPAPIAAPAPAMPKVAPKRPVSRIEVRAAQSWQDENDQPAELNRTVAIVGALTLVVAVAGAWAGMKSGQEAQAVQPNGPVTARLPKATPAQARAETESGAVQPVTAVRPLPVARPVERRRVLSIAAPPPAPPRPGPERSVAEQNQFARNSIAQAVAAEPEMVETQAPIVSASMPLPDRTIARTIERIGYRCGSVYGTAAGATAGVFTVTCSSGQSFQARPVRGRYRFRRL
ncbi:MAG: hypothetical protein V4513_07510 [Pseudomonadota bacterium]